MLIVTLHKINILNTSTENWTYVYDANSSQLSSVENITNADGSTQKIVDIISADGTVVELSDAKPDVSG
jgi:hypothetical protein